MKKLNVFRRELSTILMDDVLPWVCAVALAIGAEVLVIQTLVKVL